MIGTILCFVGWHHWEFTTTESGPVTTVTGRCRRLCRGAGKWRLIDQRSNLRP